MDSEPLSRDTPHGIRYLAVALAIIWLPAAPAAAQTGEYAIGPQDVLSIAVWEYAELSGMFSVESDGTISYPLLGRTKLGGLTVQAAERTLEKLLSDGYVKKPQVRISVDKYLSQRIFVMGEIKSPGEYPFTGDQTLLEALARAGGVTERAGSEAVLVRPDRHANAARPVLPDADGRGAQIVQIDLADLYRAGSPGTLDLRPGDTIYVPKAETVFVSGQVSRPGEYTIRSGTTLLQALSLAGGVTDRGSTRRIKVLRIVDGLETEVPIKLQETVQAGDTIIVRERLF